MQTSFVVFFVNRIVAAFSGMLLHSLWQGAIFALAAYILMIVTKKQKAAIRYNLVLLLFAAFLFTSIFTFIARWNAYTTESSSATFTMGLSKKVSALFTGNFLWVKQLLDACANFFTANAPLVVLVWFVVFTFRLTKIITAIIYNQRVKTKQVYDAGKYWNDTIEKFSSVLQLKKAVRLLESGYISMPVVIGHLKPVILLPVGLLMSLPPEQAEAILLHELAHIRRNDYLINFLQRIVETIFFFNPAMLWMSSFLHEEREHCCDDMALAQTQNRTGLAEALITFKQFQLNVNAFVTAFPGQKNQLLNRVRRILGEPGIKTSVTEKFSFAIAAIVLIGGFCTILLLHEKITVNNPVEIKKVNQQIATDNSIVQKTSVPKIESYKTVVAKKNLSAEKVIVIENNVGPKEKITEQPELISEKELSFIDEERAKENEVRAIKDQQQANLDQEQALRDQKQAMVDQELSRKDQLQAKIDYKKAMADRSKAKLDLEQANIQMQKALRDKQEAEKSYLENKTVSTRL